MRVDRLQMEITRDPSGYTMRVWAWDGVQKRSIDLDEYRDLALEEVTDVAASVTCSWLPGTEYTLIDGVPFTYPTLF